MNYYFGLTITGIITGIIAGVFGSGAEILIVPLLTILGLLDNIKKRIGTSLFMILPPIGIFSVMKFYKHGQVDIKAGLYLALLFTIFSYFTTKLAIDVDIVKLRKLFAIFTIGCGIYIFFNE